MNRNKSNLLFVFILLFAACSNPPANPSNSTSAPDSGATISKQKKDPFLRNGDEETKYPNGVIETKGNYINGKRDGQWYSWYNTGLPWSETYFDNGIKNGPTKTWFENGKLRYEGQFTKDVQSGTWKYYDETGKLIKNVDYSKK